MPQPIIEDKLKSSAIKDETRQLIEYLNNNDGKSDLNKTLEKLKTTEHFYNIYSGLIGADILEDIEENGVTILKLKSSISAGTADREIQTKKSNIYGDIELELDEKFKTINCYYCSRKYPLYDWPIYVRHVKDEHFSDKKSEQLSTDDNNNDSEFEDIIELDVEENTHNPIEVNEVNVDESLNNSFECIANLTDENESTTFFKIFNQIENSKTDKPLDFEPMSDVESLECVDFDKPLKATTTLHKLKPVNKENQTICTSDFNTDCEDIDASEDEVKIYTSKTKGTEIFFKHTKPEVVIDFLEILKSHPILWETENISSWRYFYAANKMVEELNTKCNESFTLVSVVSSIKRFRDWYSKVLYNITNIPNPDDYHYIFREYFEKCLEFWPIHYVSIPCEHCKESQNTEIGHQMHLCLKHGIGTLPYECKRCNVQFQDQGTLNKHKFKHAFANKAKLLNIKSTSNHKQSQNLYSCNVCDKVFKIRAQYTEHKFTHMERNFFRHKCDICHRKYPRLGKLNAHKRIHELKTCEICGKTMHGSYRLKEHILGAHEGKIICIVCDKKFNERIQLRNHQARHHFVLEGTVDDLQYMTRTGYKAHATGRDPVTRKAIYQCKKCNRYFAKSISHRNHLIKVHNIRKKMYHSNQVVMHRLQQLQQKMKEKFKNSK